MPDPSRFDVLADAYDADFTHSETGKLQRKRVWHFLEQDLPSEKPLDILEVNCGTGEDAVWLMTLGHRVWATDISPEMIRQAKAKAPESIAFEICGFESVGERFKDQKFDVIFSDFAGLNCVDDDVLKQLQFDFAGLLNPGGKFIGVFLGKKPLVERWYFRLKGASSKVRRRMSPASVPLSGDVEQPTWYYSKAELGSLFQSFELLRSKPIGLFIPPSYMEPWVKRHPQVMKVLWRLESVFGGFGAWADRGDHIYLVFEKQSS